MGQKVTRQRAIWKDQVVTVIQRGRFKSTIRDQFGFLREDVPNKELDQLERQSENEPDSASFTFETVSKNAS